MTTMPTATTVGFSQVMTITGVKHDYVLADDTGHQRGHK